MTTAAERNPRLVGATCTDLIDNVIYNYAEGPSGNPSSANLIGNTYQRGPAPAAAGLAFSTLEWRYAKDVDFFHTLLPSSTWTAGNRALGFAFATPTGDDLAVRRAAPACPPSVASQGAATAYAMVLSLDGPAIRSDQTARRLGNVARGAGTYYSGARRADPRPSWP